jgi:RNA polymerase sigma-70 factor (ECF subfamily)
MAIIGLNERSGPARGGDADASARRADPAALEATDPETWVDRHGDCLYRYALMRLGDPDQAADVVQETFVEALRGRDGFSGRSTERTWLIGILRHKVLDEFRKSGRERIAVAAAALEDSAEALAFTQRGGWRAGGRAWRDDPSRALESQEFWDAFSRCLARLPRGLADAFFLRELDGLGGDEVCGLLRITPANLWARIHRARLLLQRCLALNWSTFGRRTTPP